MKKLITLLIACLLLAACNETPMATSALEEQTLSSSAAAVDTLAPPTEVSSSSVSNVSSSATTQALYVVEIGNVGTLSDGCGGRYVNGSVGADSISNVAKVYHAIIYACGEQAIIWNSGAQPLETFREWVSNDSLFSDKVLWSFDLEGGSTEEMEKSVLIYRVENFGTALMFFKIKEDENYIYVYVKPAS